MNIIREQMRATKNYGGLDRFRIIAAVLVIAIHTSPLTSVSEGADFFLTRVLARIAVPFFFMVTGQFVVTRFLSPSVENIIVLKNYLKKTLLLYVFCILLYLPIGIYAGHYQEITLGSVLRMLLFDGTFYHLWYFPACILGMLLVFLMSRFLKLRAMTIVAGILYGIGLFGDSYFGLVQKVPAIETIYEFSFQISSYTRNGVFLAPLFLILGAWMGERAETQTIEADKPDISERALLPLTLMTSFSLMTVEAFILRHFKLQRHDSMYLMLIPVMLFLYQCLLRLRMKPAKRLRTAAAWVYILHPAFIVVVRAIGKLLHQTALLVDNSIVHYLVVTLLSVAAGFAVTYAWKVLYPYIPTPLFSGALEKRKERGQNPRMAEGRKSQKAKDLHSGEKYRSHTKQEAENEESLQEDELFYSAEEYNSAPEDDNLENNGLGNDYEWAEVSDADNPETDYHQAGMTDVDNPEFGQDWNDAKGTDNQKNDQSRNSTKNSANPKDSQSRNGTKFADNQENSQSWNALKDADNQADSQNWNALKSADNQSWGETADEDLKGCSSRSRTRAIDYRKIGNADRVARGDFRAWIEIDAGALEQNVAFLRSKLPQNCRLMPSVKAEGYGHGAVLISQLLNRMGVDNLCVACISEGIDLREAGIQGKILILGYTPPDDFPLLHRYQLTQTVIDYDYAKRLNQFGKKLHVHIGIDTGMHRLGIRCENIEDIMSVYDMENLVVDGLFTHLSASDSPHPQDRAFTDSQVQAFYQVVDILENEGYACHGLHLLASYGILNLLSNKSQPGSSELVAASNDNINPGFHNVSTLAADYVRPGIALYGVLSTEADSAVWHDSLKPVLSLKTRVASLRTLYAGEAAGYGIAFTAMEDMQIATLSIGYADGLPRELSNGKGSVLINGYEAPIIGRICMDQTIVDVSKIPDIQPGDTAVIIGKSGKKEITVGRLAEQCNTITNEILSRLGARLDRILL